MKCAKRALGIVFAIVLPSILMGCCEEDYSGTYYVNLASQPRWVMDINQTCSKVAFSMDGAFPFEGKGTVNGNTMTLAADLEGTIHIVITFSADGESFSGTWDHTSSGGTISGSKRPWVTYDVDPDGVPQFVASGIMDIDRIAQISRFRSGIGHDFSDDFESCRSMKHYFVPVDSADKSSINILSPMKGTVSGLTDEWSEESEWKGTAISIQSEDHPAFHMLIFHLDLIPTLSIGDEISAGQLLGHPVGDDSVTIADTAVGVNTPGGYKLVSFFEVMTDSAFDAHKRGYLNSLANVIISEKERDDHSLTCNGEQFADEGDLVNWITLAP